MPGKGTKYAYRKPTEKDLKKFGIDKKEIMPPTPKEPIVLPEISDYAKEFHDMVAHPTHGYLIIADSILQHCKSPINDIKACAEHGSFCPDLKGGAEGDEVFKLRTNQGMLHVVIDPWKGYVVRVFLRDYE